MLSIGSLLLPNSEDTSVVWAGSEKNVSLLQIVEDLADLGRSGSSVFFDVHRY